MPEERSHRSGRRNRDDDGTVEVAWRPYSAEGLEPPIVARRPYLELSLEYPGLEATRFDDAFVPDAVPYRLGDEHRVFYWREAMDTTSPQSEDPRAFCATTYGLLPVKSSCVAPDLWSQADDGREVVVDGTVGGGSTTTLVAGHSPPHVEIVEVTDEFAEVTTPNGSVTVERGDRTTVSLSEATVEVFDSDPRERTVSPELTVRFPGVRTLYHPPTTSGYALFPSFGLDVEAIPAPLEVPTVGGALDHTGLRELLLEDPSGRPFVEDVLWQAFCYTAFDPHEDRRPKVAQFDTGLVAVVR